MPLNILPDRFFSIQEFQHNIGGATMDDNVALARITEESVDKFNDLIEDMFITRSLENISCNILITQGEIAITVNYKNYTAPANSMISFMPLQLVTYLKASRNVKAYVLITKREFITSTIIDKKPISVSQILNTEHSPVIQFTESQAKVMKECYTKIEHYLLDTEHCLRNEVIQNAIYNLILEFANIFIQQGVLNKTAPHHGIKEGYIRKFIELLVEYGEKEHNPSFYADKLCISVQYLSLILKEVSGRTANVWIARYLITRAKVMLRKPQNTIQQISETLNFSDQSSFGKFFKKHVGVSPKRYKEDHTIY